MFRPLRGPIHTAKTGCRLDGRERLGNDTAVCVRPRCQERQCWNVGWLETNAIPKMIAPTDTPGRRKVSTEMSAYHPAE